MRFLGSNFEFPAEEQEEFLEKSKKIVGECCAMDLQSKRDTELLRKTEDKFIQEDNTFSPEEVRLF